MCVVMKNSVRAFVAEIITSQFLQYAKQRKGTVPKTNPFLYYFHMKHAFRY